MIDDRSGDDRVGALRRIRTVLTNNGMKASSAATAQLTTVGARVKRCLHIAAEAAELVVRLRDKPRLVDYLALSVRFADVASRIRDEVVLGTYANAWDYFNSHASVWQLVPQTFTKMIHPHVRNRTKKTIGEQNTPYAWEGVFGEARVGWIAGQDGASLQQFMVLENDRTKMMDELRAITWRNVDGNHAVLSIDGIITDQRPKKTVISTEFVRGLSTRISKFLDAGDMRSYLVHGLYGTGKTTAIQHVAHETGLKVLRVPLVELQAQYNTASQRAAGPQMVLNVPFGMLVEMLAPDILVTDDVDRSGDDVQNALLEFMEQARTSVKIIIASANNVELLTPALQRPERFDDHVEVPPLSEETLAGILGTERDVAEALRGWPIVYVLDYLQRVKVLGSDLAREEIPAMAKRVGDAGRARPEEQMLAKMFRGSR